MKLFFMLLIAILVPASAHADGGFEFKGVPLGAPEAELLRLHPRFECHGTGIRYCTMSMASCPAMGAVECMKTMSYGGVMFKSVTASLTDGRVSSVQVITSARTFEQLRDSLLAGYGLPAQEDATTMKTKAGVEVANIRYTWTRGDELIFASRYMGDIDSSSVMITSKAALAANKKRREEAAKAGAKDL